MFEHNWFTDSSLIQDDGAEDPWPMDEPVNQSVPIVLPITDEQKSRICVGEDFRAT